ncbi:class I adenylate-forming enzyme family protein [Rhodococcus jostii]|uniref:class I adenylate-forming enzyme family protein n=1 Tax=Rhodococcus jostii TaxID=132919 RepID=UPI00364111F0
MSNPLNSVTDHVEHWAHHTPDAIAVSSFDTEISYAELLSLIDSTAARLSAAGVRPGDRVVLSGINTPAWVVTFLAALRMRAVIVPLNSRLGAEQLRPLIDLVEPRIVLVDHTQLEVFTTARIAESGTPVHPLGSGDITDAFTGMPIDHRWYAPGTEDRDTLALLSFTSGTTGNPKAASISHGSLVDSSSLYVPWMALRERAVSTILVPLFHNTGYVDQLGFMLVIGGQVDLVPRFRTTTAIDAMTRRPPSHLASVPSIYRMLMLTEHADTILGSCRHALVGGAGMPPAWSTEFFERWPELNLFHVYGLTEFTSATHLLPAEEIIDHGDTVGYPVAGVQCSIRDTDGNEVPVGAAGEVWVSGPMRMLEYWKRPDATADAFSGQWLRTGDVGAVDPDGRLRLLGRINQVINRGGEKILPTQLEDLLAHSTAIAEVAVVGLPDPVMGERIVAGVVLRDGHALDETDAKAQLHGRVPDYAVPEQFVIIDELPHNASGKIDRTHATELISHLASVAAEYS